MKLFIGRVREDDGRWAALIDVSVCCYTAWTHRSMPSGSTNTVFTARHGWILKLHGELQLASGILYFKVICFCCLKLFFSLYCASPRFRCRLEDLGRDFSVVSTVSLLAKYTKTCNCCLLAVVPLMPCAGMTAAMLKMRMRFYNISFYLANRRVGAKRINHFQLPCGVAVSHVKWMSLCLTWPHHGNEMPSFILITSCWP